MAPKPQSQPDDQRPRKATKIPDTTPDARPLEYVDTQDLVDELRARYALSLFIFSKETPHNPGKSSYDIFWTNDLASAIGLTYVARQYLLQSLYSDPQ